MFETFHQSPHGNFKPTFYNPFEVKHRRRTTKSQYRVLEATFQECNKPNASARRSMAAKLGMTPRAVQVWFQNRRAKNKNSKGDTSGSESASPTMTQEEHTQRVAPTRITQAGLGRRHSMPDMQPLNGTSLPFRELHEAIFGKALRMSSSHHQVDPGTTAIPKIQQRKNSGCSVNFLNSFLNLGLASGYEQYGGGGLGNHPNAQSNLYDPMISGETNGRLLKTSDMATPSISAPGSSPTLSASDDLFQLHNALRNGQTPNAAAVEAMAARLSSALSPAELDLLIQNVATPKKDVDFFSNPDLAALLFPGTETAGNSVNPMELLSCLPHSSDQFLYSSTFADDHIEQQFS